MIDYDKLKEIINNHDRIKEIIMELIPQYYKTEELTQPEPKYKDAWYAGNGGHPRCTKVLNQEGYAICDETDKEALGLHVTAYPTKAALIEAQIEYWLCLKSEEKLTPNCDMSPLETHPSVSILGEVVNTQCESNCEWDKILTRLCDYWRDKKLADKCGLKVNEICKHEPDMALEQFKKDMNLEIKNIGFNFKCIKCGEFYR